MERRKGTHGKKSRHRRRSARTQPNVANRVERAELAPAWFRAQSLACTVLRRVAQKKISKIFTFLFTANDRLLVSASRNQTSHEEN